MIKKKHFIIIRYLHGWDLIPHASFYSKAGWIGKYLTGLKLLETFFINNVSIFVCDYQYVILKNENFLNGNFGNKKCFHSFAADLTNR